MEETKMDWEKEKLLRKWNWDIDKAKDLTVKKHEEEPKESLWAKGIWKKINEKDKKKSDFRTPYKQKEGKYFYH